MNSKGEQQKYSEIIMDFSYLKVAEAHEQKLEESVVWLSYNSRNYL